MNRYDEILKRVNNLMTEMKEVRDTIEDYENRYRILHQKLVEENENIVKMLTVDSDNENNDK